MKYKHTWQGREDNIEKREKEKKNTFRKKKITNFWNNKKI